MQFRRFKSNARTEQGAALVEFALIAPILLAMLMGILSVGMLYNQKLNLTYAAREGARYGATHNLTDPNWAKTVANVVASRSSGDLKAADVCVSLVRGSGGAQTVYNNAALYSTKAGACIANDGDTSGNPRVQITATKVGTLQAVVINQPVQLNAAAIGAFEQ